MKVMWSISLIYRYVTCARIMRLNRKMVVQGLQAHIFVMCMRVIIQSIYIQVSNYIYMYFAFVNFHTKRYSIKSSFIKCNLLNSIPCFRNQARIVFVCKKSYWYHLRRVVFNMIKIQHSRIYCRTIDIVNRFYRLLYSVTQVLEKMFLFISHFLISAHWKKHYYQFID